jgi:hypothetical protein
MSCALARPAADQLVAHPAREGKIGDPVTMQMTELATADPKLDPAEAIRTDLHPWPRRHRGGYPLRRTELLVTHERTPRSI